jgi:hypothetical protein
LTDRLSEITCSPDFQKVFLGILESASIRSAKSGMAREMEWRNQSMTGDFSQFLKVGPELEKRESMEIVNTVRDLAAVLVFLGVAMTPRAILAYFILRGKE